MLAVLCLSCAEVIKDWVKLWTPSISRIWISVRNGSKSMTSFARGLLKGRGITICSLKISDPVAISPFSKEKVKVYILAVIVDALVTRNNRPRKTLFKITLWKMVSKPSLDLILLGPVNKRKDFKRSHLNNKINQGLIPVNKWPKSKLNMLIRKDSQNWCRVMYHNLRNVSQPQG